MLLVPAAGCAVDVLALPNENGLEVAAAVDGPPNLDLRLRAT